MRNRTRLKKLAGRKPHDLDSWGDWAKQSEKVQWILEKTVCRWKGHDWQTKMRDRFCGRCSMQDYTYYQRGDWSRRHGN